ncbi:MAG TPA: ABC transporter permease [Solirubrobacteraceae bacterium]|nr:ABC transporter permease [Solirubrobacteraceae bacterium]
MNSFVDAVKFIFRNGQIPGQPHFTTLTYYALGTVKITVFAMGISLVIALPLGVWLGHRHRGSFVAINLGNIGRALPSLVVLAVASAFLGIGLNEVLVALVVLAVPPIITNAYVGIDEVDPDLVDAARGMGMTGLQVLRQVEMPLAVPLLMAGVRTATLFVISTTTLAAYAGYGDSLGEVVNNEAGYHLSGVLGAAICIAAMAIVIEVVLALVQRALTPEPLRRAEQLALPDEQFVPAIEAV